MRLTDIDTKTTDEEMDRIANVAKIVFYGIQPLLERKDPGFVYTIRYGMPECFCQKKFIIGNPAKEKILKYNWYSEEKISRTMANGHRTSLESAFPERGQYAGAIVSKLWGHGISGCTAADDHCLAIMFAVSASHVSEQAALAHYVSTAYVERYLRLRDASFEMW